MKTSVRLAGALALLALPVWAADLADFSGAWSSTYGLLTLKQTGERVVGSYNSADNPSLIEGTVQGRRLAFTYREPNAAGAGWFDLAEDGASFDGRWREDGDARWSRWTGERATDMPGETATPFAGIWNSTFGPIRLHQTGETVQGFYRMRDGRFAEVVGKAKGHVLDFTYDECGVKGTGQFLLASGGAEFTGTWQATDDSKGEWTGMRCESQPGRLWLIVLEARWEESLEEREYAYGAMLKAYFARMPNVECRHRFFDDADSLLRVCSEIPFLPEPAVVVIASHGSEDGIAVGDRTIDAGTLATCFARADNVALLHFSSCLIMAGTVPSEISKRLPAGIAFPMSGYATSVDWGASAASEFLYLDLVLARGLEPAEAMEKLVQLLPVAGDRAPADSPFEPLGIRLVPAGKPSARK